MVAYGACEVDLPSGRLITFGLVGAKSLLIRRKLPEELVNLVLQGRRDPEGITSEEAALGALLIRIQAAASIREVWDETVRGSATRSGVARLVARHVRGVDVRPAQRLLGSRRSRTAVLRAQTPCNAGGRRPVRGSP